MQHPLITLITLTSFTATVIARSSLLEPPASIEVAEPLCGTEESFYAPCLSRERADSLFAQCCELHVTPGCRSLCTYESDKDKAYNTFMTAVESGKCKLRDMGPLLHCANQNQDNRACCKKLGLADPRLGNGDRCLRFCDPAGENGITRITPKDIVCLFNWNVISYCAHSGIPFET